MTAPITIRQVTAQETLDRVRSLSTVLIDCVEGGASVNFLLPLSTERADRFWQEVAAEVAAGDRLLLVAEAAGTAEVLGTVQVARARQENAPQRGELAKLLVHRSARGLGLGGRLMDAAEAAARTAGVRLLVLDTETGSTAERLYERLGWTRVGVIPDYALTPDSRLCATTLFYKLL